MPGTAVKHSSPPSAVFYQKEKTINNKHSVYKLVVWDIRKVKCYGEKLQPGRLRVAKVGETELGVVYL